MQYNKYNTIQFNKIQYNTIQYKESGDYEWKTIAVMRNSQRDIIYLKH